MQDDTIQIKFCGIRREEDVAALNRLRPDLAGFVFAKSPRQITEAEAAFLKQRLDSRIKTVAVLVNMPAEEAALIANNGIADMLQLHGDEDAAYITKLRMLTAAKIIKAIRLKGEDSVTEKRLLRLLQEAGEADYYLFDAFVPGTYGGTGRRFDISLLKGLPLDKPFFLAGGLQAGNVTEIIRQVQKDKKLYPYFYGVDVSGGIETNGYKDPAKMEAFMEKISACVL